ncbi:MAG: hypothetical protein H6587_05580 [Flavobacteriales bacterium]|nr:hypothetical protein [Flavobacteriales bacterium]MCB9364021.1 hypothetical protein [Flavobacteriales bacterium]
MGKEIKLNTITWLALVLLIVVSTLFSENGIENSYIIISSLAVVKFLSVMFQFVEAKHAHLVWKIVSVTFVLVYVIGIIILY